MECYRAASVFSNKNDQFSEIDIKNPNSFGLKQDEFEKIKKTFSKNISSLSSTCGWHFRKNETVVRTLVEVPSGPHEGKYILLKSKGDFEQISAGKFNRLTGALNIKTGEIKAYRSGSLSKTTPDEIEVNKILQFYPDYFAAGFPIIYEGTVSKRTKFPIENKETKTDLSPTESSNRKRKVNDHLNSESVTSKKQKGQTEFKAGFIMNNECKGDLELFLKQKRNVTQYLDSAKKILIPLKKLHALDFVHGDLKPANILIGNEGNYKLTDFGCTQKQGTKSNKLQGSPAYFAPEKIKLEASNTAMDIWSYGVLLSIFSHGSAWSNTLGSKTKPKNRVYMELNTEPRAYFLYPSLNYAAIHEKNIENIFKNRANEKHLDSIIVKCLNLDPKERPTCKELIVALEKIEFV